MEPHTSHDLYAVGVHDLIALTFFACPDLPHRTLG